MEVGTAILVLGIIWLLVVSRGVPHCGPHRRHEALAGEGVFLR
jgi:hypothetical protein